MKPLDLKRLNTQIYSEASDWLVEFRAGDIEPGDRKAFNRWLRTSPEHVRAYLELAAIWNEGGRLDLERKFDDHALLQSALSESNIVPLEFELAMPEQGESRSGERASMDEVLDISVQHEERSGNVSRLLGQSLPITVPASSARGKLLSIAASILVLALTSAWWLNNQRGLYQTDTGEQRSVTLADGTHIELNARTKIRVNYGDNQRHIDLLDGQAYFHVARDAARPFIVASGNTQVRAVGTQFDVYRKTSGTIVTVVEGRVAVASTESAGLRPQESGRGTDTTQTDVRPQASALNSDKGLRPEASELLLAAGEQLIVTGQTTDRTPQPDVAAATAWTQKRLVFNSAPLSEVADEFNRYNQRPLVITSPELSDFRITGIFSSTDPGSLIRFLDARSDISITERRDDILVAREP